MAKSKPFAIRIDQKHLEFIDLGIKDKLFGNRSHAVDRIIKEYQEKCSK